VRPPRKPLFIGFLGEPQKSNRQYRAERDPRLVPRRSTGGRDTMGRQIERKWSNACWPPQPARARRSWPILKTSLDRQ